MDESGEETALKARAAVLHTVGAPPPCEKSQPLRVEEIEIDPRGPLVADLQAGDHFVML